MTKFNVTYRVDAYAIFEGTVEAETEEEAYQLAKDEKVEGIDWEKPVQIDYFDDRRIEINGKEWQ